MCMIAVAFAQVRMGRRHDVCDQQHIAQGIRDKHMQNVGDPFEVLDM